MFDSVPTVIETLETEYASNPSVGTAIDLTLFYSAASRDTASGDSTRARRKRRQALTDTVSRSKALEKTAPDQLALETLRERLKRIAREDAVGAHQTAVYVDYADDVLALAAMAVEIRQRYPEAPLDDVFSSLEAAIAAAVEDDIRDGLNAVLSAGTKLYEVGRIVRRGDELLGHIQDVKEPRFSRTAETIEEEVAESISQGDADRLESVAERIKDITEGTWTRNDLLSCSHQEFEVLVCDLWREGGFDARTTKFSQDFNIDVIVERPDGDLNLIQAKQYERGNPVGVKTVQRTAGLIVEFDAEEVYVVTSSSFTESAHQSASRMDHEITLIDGEKLRELLTRSPLVPPL